MLKTGVLVLDRTALLRRGIVVALALLGGFEQKCGVPTKLTLWQKEQTQ